MRQNFSPQGWTPLLVFLFLILAYSSFGLDSLQVKTSVPENFPVQELTAVDYGEMLGKALAGEGPSDHFEIKVDSLGDDLSNGSIGQPYGPQLAKIAKARKAIKIIKETGNFILKFTGDDIVDFPIGISKKIGNVTYTMGIASMTVRPTHAELEIYMEIDIPGKPPLLFGSPNVKFTKNGGIVGGACLGLLADFPIDIVKHKSVMLLKAAEVSEDGMCSKGTYVAIDCNGFQELSVEAEILFSRDWIKPADGSAGRVQGEVLTQISSWEDILITFSVDDFVINKLEDVRFRVDSMLFDFSDTKQGVVAYPQGYVHPLKNTPLWRGFYVKQFQVDLPKKLTGNEPKTIDGQNIIIDNTGFTGKVSTYPNVIEFGGKTLNGFAFGVDTFTVDVVQQSIVEVSVDGRIQIPIFGDGKDTEPTGANALVFEGSVAPNNVYSFIASPDSVYEAGLWKADITLNSNTTFEIFSLPGEDDIKVEAILHGFVSISDDGTDPGEGEPAIDVEISDIEFEGLTVRNFAPYFEVGQFTVPSINIEIATFEINIDSLVLSSEVVDGQQTAGLSFDLSLILDGDLSIDAGASFFVKGYLDTSGSAHKWKKKQFGMSAIHLQASWPGVENASASLELYNEHPQYGKGFRGSASVAFEGISVGISAIAQFGKKDGTKYFMIDALAEFDGPSPINIGGLEVKGFGGGIYRHMARESDIDLAMSQMVEGDINQLGAGLSGIIYNFDPDVEIGLKATVVLASSGGGGEGFNANITLGLEFGTNNTGGIGLSKLFLEGSGQFMAPIDDSLVPPTGAGNGLPITADSPGNMLSSASAPEGGSATLKAYVLMDFDFQANIYNARMKLFVESEPDFISGTAWAAAQLNIPDNIWYIHVGLPSDRNQLHLNILNALYVDINCYFAVGNTNIPDVPPAQLTGFQDILDEHFNNYNGRTGNLDNGAGLIFGAAFNFGTGEDPVKFLFFRGEFNGGIGFDIGVKKQGGDCAEAVGIDGWYAKGQVYAGFQARVWAKIKFLGIKKDIDIFSTRVAAGLKAELPNPFYAMGFVYYELSVLGIINFDGDFKLEVGKKMEDVLPADCEIEEPSEYEEVEAIYQLSIPDEDLEAVNLNATFKMEMLIPNNAGFTVTEENGDLVEYRVTITECIVRYQGSNENVDIGAANPDYTGWDDQNKVYTMRYINFLPGNADLYLSAVARLQSRLNGEGQWQDVEEDGELVQESKTLEFKTVGSYNEIPLTNFDAAYPLPNQKYFLIDQYVDGYYLDLTSNQYGLFTETPEGYEVKFRFRDSDGVMVADNLEYWMYNINEAYANGTNSNDQTSFPGQFIKISKTDKLKISSSYYFECAWILMEGEPDPEYGEEHILFNYPFNTSQYKTLPEKVEAMSQDGSQYIDGGDQYAKNDNFISTQKGEEIWEPYDLNGGDAFIPLIEVRIKPMNCQYENWGPNDWYCNEAYYLDFTYIYLPDCFFNLNLEEPNDAVYISQDNYEGTNFQLHSDFQAQVYEHAELIYNKLDETGACAGTTEIPPSPPCIGCPTGVFGEPVGVSELPTGVATLRDRLVNAKYPNKEAEQFGRMAKEYTNMYTRSFGEAKNSALRFKDKYASEEQEMMAIQQYEQGYAAAMANNASPSTVKYTATGGGGNTGQPPMALITPGAGMVEIEVPGGGTITYCAPDWVAPYCQWPILPANLYNGAQYEVEVIYRLPRLASKETPRGTLIMKN